MSISETSIPTQYYADKQSLPATLADNRLKIFLVILFACVIGCCMRFTYTKNFVLERMDLDVAREAGNTFDMVVVFGTVFGLGISTLCILFVSLGIIHAFGRLAQNNSDRRVLANGATLATIYAVAVPQLIYFLVNMPNGHFWASVIYLLGIVIVCVKYKKSLSSLHWFCLIPLGIALVVPLVFFSPLFLGGTL